MTFLNAEVTLEGFGTVWKPGDNMVDLEVTLGQNDKSSNTTIKVTDPDGKVAAALINHTIKSGGILPLDAPSTPDTFQTPTNTTSVSGDNGAVSRGGVFSPKVLAFLDLIAYKEVPLPLARQGYFSYNYSGYFSEAEASTGFPASAGTTNVGRYQFNKHDDYDDFFRKYPTLPRNYLPETQDKMAVWKMQYVNRGWGELQAGDIRGAIAKASQEWTSMPGGAEVQAGYTIDKAIAYYNQRLAYYQGGQTALPQPDPTQKVTPDTTKADSGTTTVKGNKLTVNLGAVSYTFFHQGTKWSESGITQISGQSVRWVMNRRKRNKTLKSLSLKQLAQQIATAHKIKLDWQANIDPEYEHIDQSGLSDYQLLVREANFAGLWVSDDNGTLTVKSRDRIKDSGFIISRGTNLVSYEIKDQALDHNNAESGLLQDEPKATVEPLTGTLQQKGVDIDPVKDRSTTGNNTQTISGKPKPGQDAVIAVNRARFKRIKGLPSTFVVPLTERSVQLKPLDAVRTEGFPSPLSRIWLVDKVTHKLSDGTTTLEVYSPVEVVDQSPQEAPTPTGQPDTVTTGWVYPCNGTVTDIWKLARVNPVTGQTKPHRGVDIGNGSGTTVYAVADGIVIQPWGSYGTAGNVIFIQHDNGYSSAYFHLLDGSLQVRPGARVKKGQVIAGMGSTGNSTGTHLHFQIGKGSGQSAAWENPGRLFPKLGTSGNSILGNAPVN
jgi:murein DD-endopeptidase MepM/ murein hydrolase activator NlpD